MVRSRWPALPAALAVWFGGITTVHAHVHLCFDGLEPPASVRWADSRDGDHEHAHVHSGAAGTLHGDLDHDDSAHDDVDIDVTTPGIAKAQKHDALAALPHVVAVRGDLHGSTAVAHTDEVRSRGPPRYSRPLARGPPTLLP